jgi:hypothetical protein
MQAAGVPDEERDFFLMEKGPGVTGHFSPRIGCGDAQGPKERSRNNIKYGWNAIR